MTVEHRTAATAPSRCLDRIGPEQLERLVERARVADDDSDAEGGRQLCCSACGAPITRENARIAVQGAHEHEFENPHGITFHIGCFADAPGCGHVGEATERWSWFPGFRWQIAVCGGCGVHLGWRFRHRRGEGFHGLILGRLRAEQED